MFGGYSRRQVHVTRVLRNWRDHYANAVSSISLQYHSADPMSLLAIAQTLLILLIILLFHNDATPLALAHPEDAQLLISVWDVKHRLASTGLYLREELTEDVPEWREWAVVSAKRRTILALHQLEWTWSLRHGYPVLSCFELGLLPAPGPRHLWLETNEQTWKALYSTWLQQWRGRPLKMNEVFGFNASSNLNERSQRWLAEADEFGTMLLAQGIIST